MGLLKSKLSLYRKNFFFLLKALLSSLLNQDNAMMQRLLARTAFDPEEASKLSMMHHQHSSRGTKQFPLGYPGTEYTNYLGSSPDLCK